MKRLLIALFSVLITSVPCLARTLVIDGRLSGEVEVRQQITFGVANELSELTYRIPLPGAYHTSSIRQRMVDIGLAFFPKPLTVKDESDLYGNRFKIVSWKNLTGDARADVVFTATIEAELGRREVHAPFPVRSVPDEALLYLKPTKLVQSSDPTIVFQAKKLTAPSADQLAAVDAIFNFVTDHIRYEASPQSYDALESLRTGRGHCQNYAHLAIALLRASGIPARIAVGLTLRDKWRIPAGDGVSIVQSMGEGLHAWVEVWFPDLGWLPYDPQQSKQFTSTRHIKYAHGPECESLTPSWIAAPTHPRYHGVITANFRKDVVDLNLKTTGKDPRGYLASNEMVAALKAPPAIALPPAPSLPPTMAAPSPSPPKPEPEPEAAPKPLPAPALKPKPESPKPTAADKPQPIPPRDKPPGIPSDKDGTIEFGNARLPDLIRVYTVSGNRGEVTMEQETAEYITSRYIFAQAFQIERPLVLEKVSLAMHKFGGDGAIYVDVVIDDGGKPGLTGIRSFLIPLERLGRKPGYDWVDFAFAPDNNRLPPGKHWIILRRSGEAILTWFYTPGKQFGGPDDTRSTSQGWQWEDILTYDFVFKVRGVMQSRGQPNQDISNCLLRSHRRTRITASSQDGGRK